MKLRTVLLAIVTLGVLGYTNWSIWGQERLISQGRPILLALAPVDPRSLIQGDYMRLQYSIARDLQGQDIPRDGYLILRVDQDDVAHYVRVQEPNQQLAPEEVILRYRERDGNLQLGAESFFFQEGHAEYYQTARYGELRVAPNGASILVGLRGERREPLGPPEDSPLRATSGLP